MNITSYQDAVSNIRNSSVKGLSVIELVVVLGIVAVLAALSVMGIQQLRESSRSTACQNKLRQIAIATLNFESANGVFPHTVPPSYSHFVGLLPYLEEGNRLEKIDVDGWANQAGNSQLPEETPVVFLCPSEQVNEYRSKTSYMGNAGVAWLLDSTGDNGRETGIFLPKFGRRTASSLSDGLSNTIAHSEFAYGTLSNRFRAIDCDLSNLTISIFDQAVKNGVASVEDQQLGWIWLFTGLSNTCYTHYLPPGNKSGQVIRGNLRTAAYSPSSNHHKLINAAKADGSILSITYAVDRNIWVQLGHISDGGQIWF